MGWLRRAIFGNMLLKLTALVCAVVLWVYVDGFVPAERTLTVPVVIQAWEGHRANVLRPDRTPTGSGLAKVSVTIRGPSRRVRLAGPGSIFGRITLEAPEGQKEVIGVLLDTGHFSIPCGEDIDIVAVAPRTVSLRVEKRASETGSGVEP